MSFVLQVSRIKLLHHLDLNVKSKIFLNIPEKSKCFSFFLEENTLQIIFNGVVDHEYVNVDKFFKIVLKCSFKRSNKVKISNLPMVTVTVM